MNPLLNVFDMSLSPGANAPAERITEGGWTNQDTTYLTDPLKFKELCWPHITFYDDQVEIIKSVEENVETFVPAGNMLGKDFISGFIALWFFCSRVPARVVTTSVDHDQLKSVLWGEIRRFIDESKFPLGLQVNDLQLRQVRADGTLHPMSQCVGRVAQKGEGLLGRHLARGPNGEPRAIAIIDEASGFEDSHYESISTWAHRILVIGNCYPCENFFRRGVKEGDIPNPDKPGSFFRKIIRIKADRSPNVRLGLAQKEAGLPVTNEEIIPGVMPYSEYIRRRATWDEHRQTVGLDAEWYEGEDIKLYPQEWLEKSAALHEVIMTYPDRWARAMGVDVAGGGDDTVWTVGDELGVMEQKGFKTRNTALIFGETKKLCEKYRLDPRNIVFDLGNGGKEHVDYMNSMGFPVRGVFFGASPTPASESREAVKTAKGGYKNKRAEMYGILRNLLDPHSQFNSIIEEAWNLGPKYIDRMKQAQYVYCIPGVYHDLHTQMAPLPLMYDAEGRLFLPPKGKPTPGFKGTTISKLLGRSPDHADSTVLMTYGLVYPVYEKRATVF